MDSWQDIAVALSREIAVLRIENERLRLRPGAETETFTLAARMIASDLIASTARNAGVKPEAFRATPSEARRDVLRALSGRGLSISAIGRLMRLSRATVRNALRPKAEENRCMCGTMFAPKSGTHKFCSRQCKEAFRAPRKAKPRQKLPDCDVQKDCSNCGDTFTKLRSSHNRLCDQCRRHVHSTVVFEKREPSAAFVGWAPEEI